jgi:hypothetical protein
MEKIQNEINERIRKASNFHHLVKGLIRNRDIISAKLTFIKYSSKKFCYMGPKAGRAQREKKARYRRWK